MDLGPFRHFALELSFDAHGVAAEVTPPGKSTITTTGIWQPSIVDDQPVGREFSAREPRRVMAVRRDKVPDPERGGVVVAAETIGGTPRTWQIDGVELTETDYFLIRLFPTS